MGSLKRAIDTLDMTGAKANEVYPRSLFIFGCLLAVLPVVILGPGYLFDLVDPQISFLQLIILSIPGLISLRFAITIKQIYYSPFLLSLYYLVGFPVRILDIETDPQKWKKIIWVGWFSFTDEAYWNLVLVGAVGMAGILAGQWLVRSSSLFNTVKPLPSFSTSHRDLTRWIWIWLLVTFFLNLVCIKFGIGALTRYPIHLPFKITGILSITMPYVPSLIGLWLFGLAMKQGDRRVVRTLLYMNLFLGLISIASTLSKAAVIMSLIPYVLCLFMNKRTVPFSRPMLRWIFVVLLVAAPISIMGANLLRTHTLSTGVMPSIYELMNDSTSDDVALGDKSLLDYLLLHSFGRVVGANECMAVISMPTITSLWNLVSLPLGLGQRNTGTSLIMEAFADDVWFARAGSDGPPSGRAFGLFGFWYFTHSWIVLFTGSAFCSGLAIFLERFVERFNNAGLSAGVGFIVSNLIWEFVADMMRIFLIDFIILSICLYVFVYHSPKSIHQRDPKRVAAGCGYQE